MFINFDKMSDKCGEFTAKYFEIDCTEEEMPDTMERLNRSSEI